MAENNYNKHNVKPVKLYPYPPGPPQDTSLSDTQPATLSSDVELSDFPPIKERKSSPSPVATADSQPLQLGKHGAPHYRAIRAALASSKSANRSVDTTLVSSQQKHLRHYHDRLQDKENLRYQGNARNQLTAEKGNRLEPTVSHDLFIPLSWQPWLIY